MLNKFFYLGFLLLLFSVNQVYSQWIPEENHHEENKCGYTNSALFNPEAAPSDKLLNLYDVKHYFINLQMERTSTNLKGWVEITATVVGNSLDTFAFELINGLTIDSVFLNNSKAIFARQGNNVYAIPILPLSKNATIICRVFYGGTPPSAGGGLFSGISNGTSPSWGNNVTWTLSEPFFASQWFPVKQVLTDKADSADVWITTNDSNKVGSNGILMAVTPMPGNKARYEWKCKTPIAYYLLSVAVAKYVDYTIYAKPKGSADSVKIQNYIYDNPATLNNFRTVINQTKPIMEKFAELFGPYPFDKEKYGHAMVPIGGGMEHQTMTTLGSFSFGLVAHELAHQWWGDQVTCNTWNHIWVNEGFARYSEYLAAQYLQSQSSADGLMNGYHNNTMSSAGGSTFVPQSVVNDANRIFSSRLTYDKGAAIVHMLRFELADDSVFFRILKKYLEINKYSTANADSLMNVAQRISGKDFTKFFQQWYYGEGYPTFKVTYAQARDSFFMEVSQTTSTTVTPFFDMLVEYKLKSPSGDTSVFLRQNQNLQLFKFPTKKVITSIQVDPRNWVVNKTDTVIKGNLGMRKHGINTIQSLYPNPARAKVVVKSGLENELYSISIYDLTGKQVQYYGNIGEPEPELNIENLKSGIYLIRIKSNQSETTLKLLIN